MIAVAPLLVACGSPTRDGMRPTTPDVARAAVAIVDREGRPLDEEEVARRMGEADVSLIGEIHGHPRGLALAARLFGRVAVARERAALSLEMLERDHQPAVDAYLAGSIDAAELGGRRGAPLADGHLAMIDAARAHGLPVVAANAPRRYARQARLEGYDALRALPPAEQALFTIPGELPAGSYRARFAVAMGADHEGGDAARIDAFFRAQALWDATMAASIARALEAGRSPVVHVAGRFHVEHDGGLVQMVRRHGRFDVFTLVVVEAPSGDDRDRADAIAFVGPAEPGAPGTTSPP